MKRALLVAMLCGVVSACAPGFSLDSSSNTQATRQYYASLIEGPTPNVAALTLLMTMMPKGGDLHHHYSGAIYAETYLDWMQRLGYCVYRADYPARKALKFTVEKRPDQLPEAVRSLCLNGNDILLPQNLAFYRELLSTWSDKDFYNHSRQQVAPDQHFFATFGFFGPVSDYRPEKGLAHLKARAVAENVQYIETMLTRVRLPAAGADPRMLDGLSPDADDGQLQPVLERLYGLFAADPAMDRAVEEYVGQIKAYAAGIDDDTFTLRFQTYVVRNDRPSDVFRGLYASFAAASRGGKIVGVNIVAPENWPVSMRDYGLHMRMFAFLKRKFPNVKIALHAGELVLGMVPPEGLQDHIRQAVEVGGAARIGHGVDIAHEYDAAGLLRVMRERKVAVEISITSNEFILGVKNEAHPVQIYRQAGVPFVIATDDAGVSRNNLSGEYVLYVSRYRPTYDMLKETVFDSIRYSFLSDAEKETELRRLEQRFAVFEAKVRDLAARR